MDFRNVYRYYGLWRTVADNVVTFKYIGVQNCGQILIGAWQFAHERIPAHRI